MDEWQIIETAPIDVEVMVTDGKYVLKAICFDGASAANPGKCWHAVGSAHGNLPQPTGWKPLTTEEALCCSPPAKEAEHG